MLNLKAEVTKLAMWIVGMYSAATGSDYLDTQVISKVFSRVSESLAGKAVIDPEAAIQTLLEQGYLERIPSTTTLYTTARGKSVIKEIREETIGLTPSELEQVRDGTLMEIATRSNRVRVPEIVAGMKCQLCGRRSDTPVTRKTCCVNKLYVFCSEACLQKWNRDWLRRQEQISTKAKSAVI